MKSILSILITATIVSAGVIHPQLADMMATLEDDKPLQVIVHMEAQADLSFMPKRTTKAEKTLYLQQYAEFHQAELLSYLEDRADMITNFHSYWIFNGVTFSATKDIIETVAARKDVDYVIDDFIIYLDDVKVERDDLKDLATPEWNITIVSAPQCWDDGYDGSGVIVGNMDTGVDVNHPALGGKWITGGWYDAVNGNPNPYDDHGHGTHTMGITCGGDGNGPFVNDIGVAPGANFIAAKCFNSGGWGQATWIHNCFQWFAGQNVVVVGNSWGNNNVTNLEFWDDCLNWRQLGIYPVFSIGNNGSSSGTAGTPGNFPTVTGVGATNSSDNMCSFSSRGPAPNQYPWNDAGFWERPDWDLIKPDIAAPGENVRSSIPGGGYVSWDGTSMACPHVTGAIAICLQKDPNLDYNTLYNILLDNADHPSQGSPYPNNNYGWGRLNCYAALSATYGDLKLVSYWIEDSAPGGNGNGIWESSEEVDIVAQLCNSGADTLKNCSTLISTADSYVTIISDSSYLGNVSPQDTVETAFRALASSSTPSGHLVDFNLHVSYLGDSSEYLLQVYINPITELTYQHHSVIGGNGDDFIDPGETVDLIVTLKNEGEVDIPNINTILQSSSSYITVDDSSGNFGTIIVGDTANNAADPYTVTASATTPYETEVTMSIVVQSAIYVDTLNFSLVIGPLIFHPTGDAYVIMKSPDQNTGSSSRLLARNRYGHPSHPTYWEEDILAKFDLSSLPGDVRIISATLYLYYYEWRDNNPGGRDLTCYRITSDWDEETVTWNTRPSYNPEATCYSILPYSPGSWMDWDVTSDVKSFISGEETNYGWQIMDTTTWGQFNIPTPKFLSKEYGSNIPYLDIEVEVEAVEEYEDVSVMPSRTMLSALFPNPFTKRTRISYQLSETDLVSLSIYDAVGRFVRNLVNGLCNPGYYTVVWDGCDGMGHKIAAGVYFIRMNTKGFTSQQKVIFVR